MKTRFCEERWPGGRGRAGSLSISPLEQVQPPLSTRGSSDGTAGPFCLASAKSPSCSLLPSTEEGRKEKCVTRAEAARTSAAGRCPPSPAFPGMTHLATASRWRAASPPSFQLRRWKKEFDGQIIGFGRASPAGCLFPGSPANGVMEAGAGGTRGAGAAERQPGASRGLEHAHDVQVASGDGGGAAPIPADHRKVVEMLRELLGGGGVAPGGGGDTGGTPEARVRSPLPPALAAAPPEPLVHTTSLPSPQLR